MLKSNRVRFYSAAGNWVVIGCRASIVIIALQWLISGNPIWFIIGLVSFVLTLLPQALLRNDRLAFFSKVLVSLFLSVHIILGMYFGFYERSLVFDKLMHMLGSFALTALVIMAITQYCGQIQFRPSKFFLFTIVLSIAVSMGVFWEVFEFTIDNTGLVYAQRGLSDTMFDLIANITGVLGALCIHMNRATVK